MNVCIFLGEDWCTVNWATEDHTIWASNHDLRWNLLVDFAAKFAGGFVQVFMKEGPRT
jgi:hypothetical protein